MEIKIFYIVFHFEIFNIISLNLIATNATKLQIYTTDIFLQLKK